MKSKKSLVIIIILSVLLLASLGGIYYLYNQVKDQQSQIESLENQIPQVTTRASDTATDYESVGFLIIPEISLQKDFVNGVGDQSCVDHNICAYSDSDSYPDKDNSHLMLGAHSGANDNAYFTRIDQLKKGSKAYIEYKDHRYTYELVDIYKNAKSDKAIAFKSNGSNKQILLNSKL